MKMLHEDPVADIDVEKQTLRTNSRKVLKYGSLIIATGCTASRFPDKIGGNLPGFHYIRDIADANSLILSLLTEFATFMALHNLKIPYLSWEIAKKVVVAGCGYIGMGVAAVVAAWKVDTTVGTIKLN